MVKNGVPFDVAMTLDPEERAAFAILFSEFEGSHRFDFDTGTWRDK